MICKDIFLLRSDYLKFILIQQPKRGDVSRREWGVFLSVLWASGVGGMPYPNTKFIFLFECT